MTSYEIKGTNGHTYQVTAETHGYRTRFFEKDAGYIGSYFPTTKEYRFWKGGFGFEGEARGPKTAARALVNRLFY